MLVAYLLAEKDRVWARRSDSGTLESTLQELVKGNAEERSNNRHTI
jgi:hypothetical protein